MVKAVAPNHEDLKRARRRARITQHEIARRLGVSPSKVSEFETRGEPLPWELTPEDFERALKLAIHDKAARA
jgi:transcriptional regulator with XRE-family HTH domain